MNYLDILLGIVLLIGLFKGIKNGLILELASLIGLIAGVYCAIHFSNYAATIINRHVEWSENTVNLVAFGITFILVVIAVTVVARLITSVAALAMLGLVNKLLGGIFGVIKTAFILSVLLMFFASFQDKTGLIDEATMEESFLFKRIAPIAPLLLPEILEQVEEYDEDFQNRNEEDQVK